MYTIFRPPYWYTTDMHQHSVSTLGSVNFCETFDEYLRFEETHRPKPWRSDFLIYLLQHHELLTFSTGWFSIFSKTIYMKTIYDQSQKRVIFLNFHSIEKTENTVYFVKATRLGITATETINKEENAICFKLT